jgi:hypothetical protein
MLREAHAARSSWLSNTPSEWRAVFVGLLGTVVVPRVVAATIVVTGSASFQQKAQDALVDLGQADSETRQILADLNASSNVHVIRETFIPLGSTATLSAAGGSKRDGQRFGHRVGA